MGLEKSPMLIKLEEVGLPVLTDVNTAEQCTVVVNRWRFTNNFSLPPNRFINYCNKTAIINVKGQFRPWDMANVIKIEDSGNKNILITEEEQILVVHTYFDMKLCLSCLN